MQNPTPRSYTLMVARNVSLMLRALAARHNWELSPPEQSALASEVIRKRIDAGPKPFGLAVGVTAQTV